MDLVILISDEKSRGYEFNEAYFNGIDQWAREHCTSYVGMKVQDVSDVSLQWDEIAAYEFGRKEDALLFKLKWL